MPDVPFTVGPFLLVRDELISGVSNDSFCSLTNFRKLWYTKYSRSGYPISLVITVLTSITGPKLLIIG